MRVRDRQSFLEPPVLKALRRYPGARSGGRDSQAGQQL